MAVRTSREVDEEPPTARVVRREGQAEQALLSYGDDGAREVQEIRREYDFIADDPDAATLLNDVLDVAITRILYERDRRSKARGVHARPKRRLGANVDDRSEDYRDRQNRRQSHAPILPEPGQTS